MIRTLLRVLGPAYARPVRRVVALMTAAAIAEGLVYALLIPVLTSLFGDNPGNAFFWLAAFGIALVAFGVLRYAADVQGFRAGSSLLDGMYRRLGDHLAALPIGWHQPGRVGEVATLASGGILQSMGVIAHLLAPLIAAAVTPLTIVVVMLAYHWQLGVAALIAVPIVAWVQNWSGRAMRAADSKRLASDQEATARVVEFMQAQPVLRATNRTAGRFEMLDTSLRALRHASRRSTLSALPGLLGLSLTVQTAFTAVLAVGAYLALGGHLAVAELVALLVLAARCADPLLSLTDLGGQMHAARAVLNKLDAILRVQPLAQPDHPARPASNSVELDSVTFRHSGRTVVDDVSFSLPEGGRLAVVGPSGAGKSSLLQLLPRFYDVDSGAVRVGGVDVRTMDPEDLMARVSIVFQHVYLFDGTIEDNVRVARPGADVSQVSAAVEAARLDEVVERLPDGLATNVGEAGTLLSGGERQRVAIARALLKDAPIVLLDEVTSALDPINEEAVHNGMEHLMADRTVVLVAHRLKTVQRADHVIFLDAGRIVEQGAHDDLLRRDGRYAEFWAASTQRI